MLEAEKDLRRWRILWAGSMALIRAVGHVLHKVDGTDKVTRDIANEFFSRWKSSEEHGIFREFVEHERNNLLKEYRSDVHPLEDVSVAIQATLMPLAGGENVTAPFVLDLDGNLFRPMLDGPWEGTDCRELYADAIAWWRSQLNEIDVEVVRRRGRNMLRGDLPSR
jgi:hypothetical protein